MSIINDALKKAQESLDKKNNKNPYNVFKKECDIKENISSKKSLNNEFSTKHKQLNQNDNTTKNLIISTSIIVIFITAFSTAMILLVKRSIPKTATIDKLLIKKGKAKTTSEQNKLSGRKQVQINNNLTAFNNNLKLEGTMMMGNNRVALISGEVYKLGETASGLKIISINLENVELIDSNGNTVTLGVKK